MSKFSEMCSAFNHARNEFDIFKKDTSDAATRLWRALAAYLEAPQERVTLYRIGPKGGFEVANPPVNEILNLREDGFWDFGLGITVYCDPSTYPRDTILLHLRIRRNLDGHIQVQLAGAGPVFNIDLDNKENSALFFDHVYTTIIDSYHSGLERLIKEDTVNRIGFDLAELATAARTSP